MTAKSDETPPAGGSAAASDPAPAGPRAEASAKGCACACVEAANEHVLSEYYGMPADARKALAKGVDAILTEKGGFLCIPPDATSECFVPRNLLGHQEAADPCDAGQNRSESVTVHDFRRGVERRYLPPVGDLNSELTTYAGRSDERDLALDLGWQGSHAVQSLCSRTYGGASSASMQLSRDTKMGEKRFYVPTLMGLFPGQRLLVDLKEPLFTVEHLGLDAQGPFFETLEAAPNDISAKAPVYNKNNVHVLNLSDTTSCDNQGTTINLHRRAYGAGDTFLLAAVLDYQSNVFSGLGDEGGVGCAVNLQHDLEGFHGVVEKWTPAAGRESEVVYKATIDAAHTRNTQKLGTSRPLINLNDTKWMQEGTANVLRRTVNPQGWLTDLPKPDGLEGCVLIRPGAKPPADWQAFRGAFLALKGRAGVPAGPPADDSEHYKEGEETPLGKASSDVYRWWHVTHVQEAGDGRAYLFVERPIQRLDQVVISGPLLFRDSNYTDAESELKEKALRYVLAPGAWVSDVRHGVAGNVLGNEGAQPGDPRRILLAPGQPKLACGDPITNPPGPDVFHPSGFRTRQIHHFPASSPGASFLSENLGRVQVGSGLHVAGSVSPNRGESMHDALRRVQKDQLPHYDAGVWITGTCDSAIRIQGYSERSALDLWQDHGDQPIVWRTAGSTGWSTLHAHRTSGRFTLATTLGDLVATLTGPGGLAVTELRGISATATPARNLRGTQEVKEKDDTVVVLLPEAEPDADYLLFLQPSWLTPAVVTTRKDTLFEVKFGDAAPAGATCDWLLVR